MNKRCPLLLMMAFLLILGCNEEITGIVVDAETGQPIEGAVVLVEWTKTSGPPGLRATESFKVFEALTDRDGKVKIEGIDDLFVNEPEVSIYYKGYVLWNNEYIFPSWEKRADFKWKNNYVFKIEKFKSEYSFTDHVFFIHHSTNAGSAGNKRLMESAYRWEELKRFEEMLEKEKKYKKQ